MLKIIGVRFKSVGKVYYFDPKNYKLAIGDKVIVETARGVECGEVAMVDREIDESTFSSPIKPIIRAATEEDLRRIENNKQKEKDAFKICQDKIAVHGLKMNLIDVECTFDNNKMLFYFTAENRVDFRELVKDLAAVFKTRIELRQIGVRDEAKMLGGLGICGQPFCCSRFLGDFQPVSIKMAKEQGLSLNPTKISGTCGRLMCCLKYEQNAYDDLLKTTPKQGAIVKTTSGRGVVEEVNLLTGKLKVKLDNNDTVTTFDKSEVEVIKDSVIRVDRNEMKALKSLEGQ
ncbi:MAG: stage 0 sporulation family protein [Ruminococcus sp.]|nr:stage 0 sporulation family protein [Ruminococcus sp.]MBQ4247512.1 stage 0 sporulation family protein [Ruminococcus sp.]